MTGIEIYSTRQCPWCVRARALLEAAGRGYREIDLTGAPGGLQRLALRSGRCTVPQVFIAGVPVGGYEELLELQRAGRPG